MIDEVDVFFSKDFHGNVYTPACKIQKTEIIALIDYIWANRYHKLTLNKVLSTSEYKAVLSCFPGWEEFIKEAAKNLICDLANFSSHSYEVSKKLQKIGYKD